MLDARIRPHIDPPLGATARWLHQKRVTAAHLTWLGLAFGALAGFCLLYKAYPAALVFFALNRLCDGLDGPLARTAQKQGSDTGAFLDIVFDFCIYAGLPFCMAAGLGTTSAWASTAFLLFGMVMSGITFMAHAVISAKRGRTTEAQGKKGMYYVAGLMEGTETILFLALMCLWPAAYPYLAMLFGALCVATGIGRIGRALTDFS